MELTRKAEEEPIMINCAVEKCFSFVGEGGPVQDPVRLRAFIVLHENLSHREVLSEIFRFSDPFRFRTGRVEFRWKILAQNCLSAVSLK